MSIVTRPATRDYRNNFDDVFGRQCKECKEPLSREVAEEWDRGSHVDCAAKASGDVTVDMTIPTEP